MQKMKIKDNEELMKVPVQAGDMVFVKFDRRHKPVIRVFQGVVPS